jgi:uncharacterized membrane protein YjjB (DUF3815 family)
LTWDLLGWIATAVFITSYFFNDATKLRWVQAVAALFWLGYGLAVHALPVVVANLIVAVAAAYSSIKLAKEKRKLVAADSLPRHS